VASPAATASSSELDGDCVSITSKRFSEPAPAFGFAESVAISVVTACARRSLSLDVPRQEHATGEKDQEMPEVRLDQNHQA